MQENNIKKFSKKLVNKIMKMKKYLKEKNLDTIEWDKFKDKIESKKLELKRKSKFVVKREISARKSH